MIHSLRYDLQGREVYIDNAIIYSDIPLEHIQTMRAFLDILAKAKTMNLAKSDFHHAAV